MTSGRPCSGCYCIQSSILIFFLNTILDLALESKVELHNGAHRGDLTSNSALHKGNINRLTSKSILKDDERRRDFGETAELLKLEGSEKPNSLRSNSVTSRQAKYKHRSYTTQQQTEGVKCKIWKRHMLPNTHDAGVMVHRQWPIVPCPPRVRGTCL